MRSFEGRHQMEKKKTINYLSFIVILLIVIQLIPSSLTRVEGFDNHTQNSKVFLSSISFNSDILYIGRESQKTSIQKLQVKNASLCIPQISFEDISSINISFQEMPFDYQTAIRQSIPHYFNGSKYKNNHFSI